LIHAGAIYGKTRAGAEEIKNRKVKISSKLRTMLILIDGTKPAFLLREEAQTLGVDENFLEQLEQLNLIERVGAVATGQFAAFVQGDVAEVGGPALAGMDKVARFRMAQQFMNDTAVNALGIKAFFFTLKLERCATVADLGQLAQAYHDAIAKAAGQAEADVLTRRVHELLGTPGA
jgi:hypothetical protein